MAGGLRGAGNAAVGNASGPAGQRSLHGLGAVAEQLPDRLCGGLAAGGHSGRGGHLGAGAGAQLDQSCSCPSGETGTCTQHWAQNTEWRVFALTPDTPDSDKVRKRVPARGSAGRRRLVNTIDNCTPIVIDGGDDPGGDDPSGDGPGDGGPGGGGPGSSGPGGGTSGGGEVGGIGGVDGGVTGGHAPGQSNPGEGSDGGDGGGKPVILDLDGDGVELVPLEDSTAFFDIDGDGYRERMAWAAPDDGFLAYDKDDDGAIAEHDELSFVSYLDGARTDLEGLRHFDTDGDGQLDADDAEWGRFRVWQDLDQDGESDEGELRSLDEAGSPRSRWRAMASNAEVAGATVFGEGRYIGPDGPRAFWDVMLSIGRERRR